jgi:DnaJ-domain-containing protein 1
MTTTGRRGRLFRRADELLDDEEGADLSEDEHAWWAAREEVAGVPRGPTPDAEIPATEPETGFSDYWSAESLYDEHAQAAPPSTDDGPMTVEVPGGMDLDSAHLVLQVRIGVTWEEITAAHRKLAKLYHPDRLVDYAPEAQELGRARMAEINAAHATLRALHFHS